MLHWDLLQTIAALSITLLGFSGIVATTGRLLQAADDPYTPIALNSMITPTLIALACSFLPELGSMLTNELSLVWRVASAILGTSLAATFLPMLFRGEWTDFQPVGKYLLTPLVMASLVAQFLAAAGALGPYQFVFVAGLLVQLTVGVTSFLALVALERRVVNEKEPAGLPG